MCPHVMNIMKLFLTRYVRSLIIVQIIDGGSTGSRLHIFEFVHDSWTNRTNCIRRGSEKVQIPLSAYAPSSLSISQESQRGEENEENEEEGEEEPTSRHVSNAPLNATHVAQHLIPLFEYAAQIVPSKYHSTTHVMLQATAGMRLLPEQEQELVYDAIYFGLKEHPNFVFTHMQRADIGALPGSVEALYGAVAANFLKGVVDVHLHMLHPNQKDDDDDNNNATSSVEYTDSNDSDNLNVQLEQDNDFDGPLGALDMGGASMQIVYLPNTDENPECHNDHHDTCNDSPSMDLLPDISHPNRLNSDEFFSVSYLSYGADQFRERLYDTFVNERDRLQVNGDSPSSRSNSILNPCSFEGYIFHWKGYEFVGTGDAKQCAMEVNRLIPHHEEPVDHDYYDDYYYYDNDEEDFMGGILINNNAMTKRRKVGGVHHPPVRGKFFAMSLFFFTLDCLRELSGHAALNASWPTPSIGELTDALDILCSRKWYGDLEHIQQNSHEFTRAEVLPDRCFEAVYMVTLLRDGFGFEWDSRDITFTYLVDGSEVEWSLGMAISHFAEEETPAVTVLQSDCSSNHCNSKSKLKGLWSHGRRSAPFQYMSTSIKRLLGFSLQ